MKGNNFEKFAKSKGVSALGLDKYNKSKGIFVPNSKFIKPNGYGLTSPMVIEERQLNISAISVFDRLMMDRIIFLGEEIDDVVANIINAQLLFLDNEEDIKEPIWIYINSPGGDVYSGLAMYDTMQVIKSSVNTCVMGMAASMAFILAIAGEKKHRYALKHSRLMMHQPWGGTGAMQATDIDIYNKEMQGIKHDMIHIMSKHTGQTEDQIKNDAERDYWLPASKAKDYGAIDKILLKAP